MKKLHIIFLAVGFCFISILSIYLKTDKIFVGGYLVIDFISFIIPIGGFWMSSFLSKRMEKKIKIYYQIYEVTPTQEWLLNDNPEKECINLKMLCYIFGSTILNLKKFKPKIYWQDREICEGTYKIVKINEERLSKKPIIIKESDTQQNDVKLGELFKKYGASKQILISFNLIIEEIVKIKSFSIISEFEKFDGFIQVKIKKDFELYINKKIENLDVDNKIIINSIIEKITVGEYNDNNYKLSVPIKISNHLDIDLKIKKINLELQERHNNILKHEYYFDEKKAKKYGKTPKNDNNDFELDFYVGKVNLEKINRIESKIEFYTIYGEIQKTIYIDGLSTKIKEKLNELNKNEI